ncbi:TetR/AcrR family transcriptional regulator [Modestobacter sp. VKM Ac-2979]|uniref:TetR/AcrR family transcriptional regulator n=1 Tax=unclassified Modestobacter TaxID=2643866 RepID=UPI0022AB716D|nr:MULTISPECIES: TetR/AcrR family transcriptional regulator [unclassified Modestobacter]MCZ2810000.1 TetR/AcrR family transcriptional regulator [Modestobacter sp. VKM Ac-2979]MCZ2842585.1 TetR/AcrR family transcriptional regulator [Modestobacter sp. VKM Ac-2980]
MPPLPPADAARPGRGGRPRDPSRDGAIRQAILQVLAESGYAALTMDAVASAAGVGKATIYRRWRTKSELVADAVAELSQTSIEPPDTGSLEGDLRLLLHWLVDAVNGPLGAATLSLLSALPHEPELREAFHSGPMEVWGSAFRQVWERAEARGEVSPAALGTAVASTASSPILQRWLFGGEPVSPEFADEVLTDVVLPLVTARRTA